MERAGMIHVANSACGGEFDGTSGCAVVEPAWTHEWSSDLAVDPMLHDHDDLGGGEDFEDDEDEDLLEEEGDDLGEDDESAEDEDDEDF